LQTFPECNSEQIKCQKIYYRCYKQGEEVALKSFFFVKPAKDNLSNNQQIPVDSIAFSS